MSALVECVPNFSEGRDPSVVAALAAAVESVPGAALLDAASDPDHNRSVLTFAGPPDAVLQAAQRAASIALRLIDLRNHAGVHPRIGALDVLPFVPISAITIEECAALAVRAASRIWETLAIPSYLYEAAARRPAFLDLAAVRRMAAEVPPDIGGPAHHPTAGAIAAGARRFLIAFNVNLDSADVDAARTIARRIRASSGGLPAVKALGLFLASRGVAQVSMNLTDFETTPIHAAFEAVAKEASLLGLKVHSTEFIGLVPRLAFDLSAGRVPGLTESLILEARL